MTHSTRYLIGWAFIRSRAPLENVADEISRALSIRLEKARIGRFEEYEGYEGEAMGLAIYLTGDDLSKPRPIDHEYQLNIHPARRLVFKDSMSFEEVDISTFLEWALGQIPGLEISASHNE